MAASRTLTPRARSAPSCAGTPRNARPVHVLTASQREGAAKRERARLVLLASSPVPERPRLGLRVLTPTRVRLRAPPPASSRGAPAERPRRARGRTCACTRALYGPHIYFAYLQNCMFGAPGGSAVASHADIATDAAASYSVPLHVHSVRGYGLSRSRPSLRLQDLRLQGLRLRCLLGPHGRHDLLQMALEFLLLKLDVAACERPVGERAPAQVSQLERSLRPAVAASLHSRYQPDPCRR